MEYLVTSEEIKRYDTNTIEKIGIPGMVLMERAALAAFDFIIKRWKETPQKECRVLIMAGMGNNGGDGLALARLLCEADFLVDVWCVGNQQKASSQWIQQFEILKNYSVRISSSAFSEEYTIIVDALFGVGLSREVLGEYREAIEQFNKIKGFKLALDIPSGICADNGSVLGCAVKADATVTFGFCKRGLRLFPGCEYTGEIIVAQIGISQKSFLGRPPAMFYYQEAPINLLPKRNLAGNKGTFGKVLMIAGSINMAGAAVLASKASYRTGAGMVKVISPEQNRVILQQTVPEALYGTEEALEESLLWADVVVIGPGIGKTKEAKGLLEKVIMESPLSLIIDADGLNLLAEDFLLQEKLKEQCKKGRNVVLTPHVGELSRLCSTDISQVKGKVLSFGKMLCEKLHVIVVAKDARTFVCKEDKPVCLNIRGNSGMATAGSGDVLSGIIAGLVAQGMNAFEAACVGVYVHACAGEAASAQKGEYGCMAGDIVENIGFPHR